MSAVYGRGYKNAAYALIKIDLGFSTSNISRMQFVQTMVLSLMVIFLGFVTDYVGCRKSSIIGFLQAIGGLLILCNAYSFAPIVIGLTFVDMAAGQVLASLTKLIGNWYRDNVKERDEAIWILYLSSRISGVTSLFLYSGLFNLLKSWRLVTLIVLFPSVIGFFLTVFFVWEDPVAGEPKLVKELEKNKEKSPQRNFLSVKAFQLLVISHCCTKIWRRSDMFLGLFFMDATYFGE